MRNTIQKIINVNEIKKKIYWFTNVHRNLRYAYDWIENAINRKPIKVDGEQIGWSFVFVSAGNCNGILKKAIEKVLKEFEGEENFEIIVVGPRKCHCNEDIHVRYVIFYDLGILPGWITKKKNIGVESAQYDKVVVCHDYVGLEEGWLAGFKQFGYDFDICVTQVLLDDGRRTRDWMTWDYPSIGPGLLPYTAECSRYQYLNGTYFICNRKFYLANELNESLRWGEEEDVEWSKRIREKTTFKININSKVKYLKPKDNNSAPYCESWRKNTEKLTEIFGEE